jgi:hypothetical protein
MQLHLLWLCKRRLRLLPEWQHLLLQLHLLWLCR